MKKYSLAVLVTSAVVVSACSLKSFSPSNIKRHLLGAPTAIPTIEAVPTSAVSPTPSTKALPTAKLK